MAHTTTSSTKYNVDLLGGEGDPYELVVRSWTEHRVTDGAGRRQWTKEGELNRQAGYAALATLNVEQAAALAKDLVDTLGWIATHLTKEA